jgi:hypothetical protein
MLENKIWANFQSIEELFTQKIVTKLSKIWVWDPGSKIRDPGKKPNPDPSPGVKKAPDPGSGSATLAAVYKKYLQSSYYFGRRVVCAQTTIFASKPSADE